MVFKHKLSKRLAISRSSWLAAAAVALLTACDAQDRGITDPTGDAPSLVIVPTKLGLDYQTTSTLEAAFRTADGDVVPADVEWSASGGVMSADGDFEADTVPAEYTVTAKSADGQEATALVGVGYSGAGAVDVSIARPAKVGDLTVQAATDSSVTLSFSEVDDGTGQPAKYHVRFFEGSMYNWGVAPSVTEGTCSTPVQGAEIGATRTCTILGLTPETGYEFRLVAFRGTLNVDAVFSPLSNKTSGTTAAEPPPADNPGQVTDLEVASATDSSITLRFTEVEDGTGQPANYDVRYALAPLGWGWGSATGVTEGTCATPVQGAVIGAQRTCTVLGLAASTAYDFQVVTYRGTLNVDAVFGNLSNVAGGTTSHGTADPEEPEPEPVRVASVEVTPATLSLDTGQTAQLTVALSDSAGNALTGRSVTWASSAPAVATVSASGLVTAVTAGTATITATSEGKSDSASVSVTAPPLPNQPPSASAIDSCVDLTCTFDAAGSSDPDGSIVAYGWDFGDGSTAQGSSTQHTYTSAGTYTVSLTVEDDDGATASTQFTASVNAPAPEPTPTSGIWISASELASLPTSGGAWNNVKSEADGSCGSLNLSDQDQRNNVCIMAKALVFARTGQTSYRTDVVAALQSIVSAGTYDGRALALGRELAAYVIAADLIDLESYSATLDAAFRTTIRALLTTYTNSGPSSLVDCHEDRPNNWGTHCGASRAAVAAYLGDAAELERVAQVFKGWLGDRTSYAGFRYGDLSWQCDSSRPVGINPAGCTRDGHSIDGVLPDDQRRGGDFTWPPPKENYVWEGLQGALAQAVILHRAGYPAFEWQDRALLRAVQWLHEQASYPAGGDDSWQPHIINRMYGTGFPAPSPAQPGKNVGWTDWTHR